MYDETDRKFKDDREYWWQRVTGSFFNKLGGQLIVSSEHQLVICLMPLAHRINDDGSKETSFLFVKSSDPMLAYWGASKGMQGLEKAQEVVEDGKRDGRMAAAITEYTTLEKIVEGLNEKKV